MVVKVHDGDLAVRLARVVRFTYSPGNQSATTVCSMAVCSNIARGVTYQSRNMTAAPCVSKAVVNGTLRKTCVRMAPESRMKRGGRPADRRLPSANTSPHTNTEIGANNGPT